MTLWEILGWQPRISQRPQIIPSQMFAYLGYIHRICIRLWGFIVVLAVGLTACRPQLSAGMPLDPAPISAASTATVTNRAPTSTARSSPTMRPSPAWTETATASATLTWTPTPTSLTCWNDAGRIELDSLPSDLLPLPLDFTVHLPPCYDEQTDRHYPVLYLIHGQNYNQDQWERMGAPETANRLVAAGEIAPFILVLPRDRSWSQPTEDMFGKVLAESLVPWIDDRYRTLPDRQFRAIGGLSRGAGWAVHLGLSYWELFGRFGAHSLPVFWSDTYHIRTWLDEIPSDSMPGIFLDIGEKDRPQILSSAEWFEQLLTERNIPHEWYLYPGYHEEAYWRSHIEQYLRWYAQDW
jgi:enterochelin esterase-like enzyme